MVPKDSSQVLHFSWWNPIDIAASKRKQHPQLCSIELQTNVITASCDYLIIYFSVSARNSAQLSKIILRWLKCTWRITKALCVTVVFNFELRCAETAPGNHDREIWRDTHSHNFSIDLVQWRNKLPLTGNLTWALRLVILDFVTVNDESLDHFHSTGRTIC